MPMPLLLAVLAAQAAAGPPLAAADNADGRCMVVLGFVGSRVPPEQRPAVQQGIMFFAGKLRGRHADIDLAQTLLRASREAQAANVSAQADLTRCQAELQSASTSLGGIRAAAGLPPRPAPSPATPAPAATPHTP